MRSGYSLYTGTGIYSQLCFNCIRKQRARVATGSAYVKTKRSGFEHTQRRTFQNSTSRLRASSLAKYTYSSFDTGPPPPPPLAPKGPKIRERLEKWQEEHGNPLTDLIALDFIGRSNIPMPDDYRSTKVPEDEQEPDLNDVAESAGDEKDAVDLSVIKGFWFNPGDLVELSAADRGVGLNLAVYVGSAGDRQAQLITPRGKWLVTTEAEFQYAIPDFVSKSVAESVARYFPSEELLDELKDRPMVFDTSVPRSITGPVVTALNDFIAASEEVYRKHAARLDNAHNIISHATDLRSGSLEQIAAKLLGTTKLTNPALYAVRRAIMRDSMGFGIDFKNHVNTGKFQIRSQEQLKLTKTVQVWLREYQEAKVQRQMAGRLSPDMLRMGQYDNSSTPADSKPGVAIISGFIDKCIPTIVQSRRSRDITKIGHIGPSKYRYPMTEENSCIRQTEGPEFNPSERLVIRFMEYWCLQQLFASDSSFLALATILPHDTGMYNELTATRSTGFLMLQEIGVLEPWASRSLYDVDLLLPTSQHSKPLQQLVTSLEKYTPEEANLQDSMADLRYDFEDLPVFCIDGAGAMEIDDGLSVEKCKDSPEGQEEHWIHVHVANPTAFIKRDSIFSKLAAHLTETFYSPEVTYPMLPKWISEQICSLKADRPTLTFSARVDTAGNIKDIDVRNGIVRKVITLTYDDLPKLLNLPIPPPTKSYIIGTDKPIKRNARVTPTLTELELEHLRSLHKLAMARLAIRREAGALHFDPHWAEVSVHSRLGRSGLPPSYSRRKLPVFTHGDPIIEVSTHAFTNWCALPEDTTKHFVREMMGTACEVAGRFAEKKGIPIIFRGTAQNPQAEMTPAEYADRFMRPMVERGETIPYSMEATLIHMHGRSVLDTKPTRHTIMGVGHYAKVTSPLRRYGDMITHWQIESLLRAEAKAAKGKAKDKKRKSDMKGMVKDGANEKEQEIGSAPAVIPKINPKDLAFTEEQLKGMCGYLHVRERVIMKGRKDCSHHWILQFLHRAYIFSEKIITVYTGGDGHKEVDNADSTSTSLPESNTDTMVNDPVPHNLSPTFPVVFTSFLISPHLNAKKAWGITANDGIRCAYRGGAIADQERLLAGSADENKASNKSGSENVEDNGSAGKSEGKNVIGWDRDFFDKVKAGDWWECRYAWVDTYQRNFDVVPLRLIKREGDVEEEGKGQLEVGQEEGKVALG